MQGAPPLLKPQIGEVAADRVDAVRDNNGPNSSIGVESIDISEKTVCVTDPTS